jgi:hypothetical protein
MAIETSINKKIKGKCRLRKVKKVRRKVREAQKFGIKRVIFKKMNQQYQLTQ